MNMKKSIGPMGRKWLRGVERLLRGLPGDEVRSNPDPGGDGLWSQFLHQGKVSATAWVASRQPKLDIYLKGGRKPEPLSVQPAVWLEMDPAAWKEALERFGPQGLYNLADDQDVAWDQDGKRYASSPLLPGPGLDVLRTQLWCLAEWVPSAVPVEHEVPAPTFPGTHVRLGVPMDKALDAPHERSLSKSLADLLRRTIALNKGLRHGAPGVVYWLQGTGTSGQYWAIDPEVDAVLGAATTLHVPLATEPVPSWICTRCGEKRPELGPRAVCYPCLEAPRRAAAQPAAKKPRAKKEGK